jgi:hypothetical protein
MSTYLRLRRNVLGTVRVSHCAAFGSRQVVIWERYRSKSDYLDVHKNSKLFLEFRPKLTALGPEIKGHGWLESDIGYA